MEPSPAAAASAAAARACPGADSLPAVERAPQIHQAILCLINAERARHGLRPLAEDQSLQAAATAHSLDMARRDYFEHETPDGVQPWMRISETGYRAELVGENLAWGEGERGMPGHILGLWLRSPGHRRNMLEPRYTQIGIGLAFDAPAPAPSGPPAGVYTTTFGSAAYITG